MKKIIFVVKYFFVIILVFCQSSQPQAPITFSSTLKEEKKLYQFDPKLQDVEPTQVRIIEMNSEILGKIMLLQDNTPSQISPAVIDDILDFMEGSAEKGFTYDINKAVIKSEIEEFGVVSGLLNPLFDVFTLSLAQNIQISANVINIAISKIDHELANLISNNFNVMNSQNDFEHFISVHGIEGFADSHYGYTETVKERGMIFARNGEFLLLKDDVYTQLGLATKGNNSENFIVGLGEPVNIELMLNDSYYYGYLTGKKIYLSSNNNYDMNEVSVMVGDENVDWRGFSPSMMEHFHPDIDPFPDDFVFKMSSILEQKRYIFPDQDLYSSWGFTPNIDPYPEDFNPEISGLREGNLLEMKPDVDPFPWPLYPEIRTSNLNGLYAFDNLGLVMDFPNLIDLVALKRYDTGNDSYPPRPLDFVSIRRIDDLPTYSLGPIDLMSSGQLSLGNSSSCSFIGNDFLKFKGYGEAMCYFQKGLYIAEVLDRLYRPRTNDYISGIQHGDYPGSENRIPNYLRYRKELGFIESRKKESQVIASWDMPPSLELWTGGRINNQRFINLLINKESQIREDTATTVTATEIIDLLIQERNGVPLYSPEYADYSEMIDIISSGRSILNNSKWNRGNGNNQMINFLFNQRFELSPCSQTFSMNSDLINYILSANFPISEDRYKYFSDHSFRDIVPNDVSTIDSTIETNQHHIEGLLSRYELAGTFLVQGSNGPINVPKTERDTRIQEFNEMIKVETKRSEEMLDPFKNLREEIINLPLEKWADVVEQVPSIFEYALSSTILLTEGNPVPLLFSLTTDAAEDMVGSSEAISIFKLALNPSLLNVKKTLAQESFSLIAAEMRSYSTSRDSITEITKSFENYRENFVEKKNSVDSNENPIKEIANKIKGKNENDQQIPYRPKEDENRDTVDEGEIDLWEGIIPEEGGVKPPALPNDENADDPTQPVVPLRPDDE